jgi:hypothetical protein
MTPGHAPRRPRMGTVCAYSCPFFQLRQGCSPFAPAVLRLEEGGFEEAVEFRIGADVSSPATASPDPCRLRARVRRFPAMV